MDWMRVGSIGMATLLLAGCGTATASFDDTAEITAPTFSPAPPSPAESPQLDALVLRDTAGIRSPGRNADPSLVGEALAAVTTEFPDIERVSDLYFDDQNVWMTIVEPNRDNLARSVSWSKSYGLYIGDQEYVEEDDDDEDTEENPTFPIGDVRVDAITALVDGVGALYPSLQVAMARLNVELSYDLGLSWRLDLVDGRGTLAILFADLDGTITAVDQDT